MTERLSLHLNVRPETIKFPGESSLMLVLHNDFFGHDSLRHGNSLVVQWLGLCTSTEGDTSSIPGQGTKMPCGAAKKKKKFTKP